MDNVKLVDGKLIELDDWYKRMDETKDLVLLAPYILSDWKEKVQKAISITRNTPAWQAYVMTNKIQKVEWQVVVDSAAKLAKSKIADIESFSTDVWAQVNESLSDNLGMSGGLDAWLANHVVVRGPIGVRWYLYYDKQGDLVIDCLPVDMRWCPFQLNEWYCNITYRSASDINAEYLGKKGIKKDIIEGLSGRDNEVRDFWNGKIEEVYINKERVWENNNPFGFPPFVVILPSAGFMLRDKGYMKYEAQDALFLNRDEYVSGNRIASIAETLALETILPGYEQASPDGKIPKSAAVDTPPGIGETIRVDVPHTKVERGDLNNAFLKASQNQERDIEHGGVTDTEAGNNTDPRSALWVTTQNGLLAEKLKPRIDAIAAFRTKSLRMIVDEYLKLGKSKGENEIGLRGVKHRYSPASLGDPATYRVTYQPMMVSKEQNIANTAVAAAQKGILPDRFILQDTMQVRDVDGMLRDLSMQKAKQLDPTLSLFEMALSYAEEAEELTGLDAEVANAFSRQLTEAGVLMQRQRRLGANPTPLPEGKANEQGLLALTGPGGSAKPETKITAEAK